MGHSEADRPAAAGSVLSPGHTVGEWSAGWDPGMELPGHAPVLWVCLVLQGALEQTGDSPSPCQAAP